MSELVDRKKKLLAELEAIDAEIEARAKVSALCWTYQLHKLDLATLEVAFADVAKRNGVETLQRKPRKPRPKRSETDTSGGAVEPQAAAELEAEQIE